MQRAGARLEPAVFAEAAVDGREDHHTAGLEALREGGRVGRGRSGDGGGNSAVALRCAEPEVEVRRAAAKSRCGWVG